MASISKRVYNTGIEVYRVFLRKSGHPPFCLTLASDQEAKAFVKAFEEQYRRNPTAFIKKNKHLRFRQRYIRACEQLKI